MACCCGANPLKCCPWRNGTFCSDAAASDAAYL
jgi:hypothetical protein